MLTDQECRAAKPGRSALKLFDGGGLHLHVSPAGYKSWRLKYRFGGKEQLLLIGPYPSVSLREARDRREDAQRQLREGINPNEGVKRAKAERKAGVPTSRTFETWARRWHSLLEHSWKAKHAKDVLGSLETEAFPALGPKALDAITPADIRNLLIRIQDRGATEAAHRLRARISAVFKLAIASDIVQTDPSASIGAALRPIKKRMLPALLKLPEAQAFLRTVEAEPGYPVTKLASRLLALTAARPGMIRMAQIGEFEGLATSSPIWRVPAEKMKLVREESEQEAFEFILPLSRQAVDLVKVAAAFAVNRKYLFPSARHSHEPFSENALNTNYRRVPGFTGRHVPHGWRSSFSTIMNERAVDLDRPADRAIIDLMLAHKPAGVEAHYNRAAYMTRRREIAQEWADLLLDGFAEPETLIDGPRKS